MYTLMFTVVSIPRAEERQGGLVDRLEAFRAPGAAFIIGQVHVHGVQQLHGHDGPHEDHRYEQDGAKEDGLEARRQASADPCPSRSW